MATIKKGILIITPFFYPNIGGVETHLSDLVTELNRHHYQSFVQTYSPITTTAKWQKNEKIGDCEITRYQWFGKNLFNVLEKLPFFDFIYLTPYLLIRTIIWMAFNHHRVDTIHSQGFNAAFIGVFIAKIFKLRHITSTHAIYDHLGRISQNLIRSTLNQTDHILCLSAGSQQQLLSWGINQSKVSIYRYWIDLDRFSPSVARPKKLTFIFVGRLIIKKGIKLYLHLAKKFPQFNFLVVGTGPELPLVEESAKRTKNLKYLGTTPLYHQASVLCTPSLYQEGYGRVVMEATACGLPVIASNLGGLPEALDKSVAILIKPTIKNFSVAIKEISNTEKYNSLQKNCRQYAVNKFSKENFSQISQYY